MFLAPNYAVAIKHHEHEISASECESKAYKVNVIMIYYYVRAYAAMRRQLVLVIFARQKSVGDLYASHNAGGFIGKRTLLLQARDVLKVHQWLYPPRHPYLGIEHLRRPW